MPIYEYTCDKCHHVKKSYKKLVKMRQLAVKSVVQRILFHKVVSHSAFHLKGGGWYKDLYSSTKTSTRAQILKQILKLILKQPKRQMTKKKLKKN